MKTRAGWWLAAGLVVLSAVPVAAGAMRLGELAGGNITRENARFFATPFPVVVHIVAATLFSVGGAFQFVPQLRSPRSNWHRRAGGLLVGCGLIVGLSGLWMTRFYPRIEGDGDLLYVLRLLFGSAMVVCIVVAMDSIRRRDWIQHGAWMTRGYAIGMGAGTQVLTHFPYFIVIGRPGELARALLMGAGWLINLAAAEWAIRSVTRAPTRARRDGRAASTGTQAESGSRVATLPV